VGAYIFGRNMFGPVRGPWRDNSWKGGWGDTPPFRNPVFVLTHYPRESIPMQGGTTFHFVTDGIHRALERATAAANGKDVCIGGVATVQQYLRAGLIDELNLAISPVLLGSGESFLGDIDLVKLGYTCTEHVAGERATHVVLGRRPIRIDGFNVGFRRQKRRDEHRIPGWSHHYGVTQPIENNGELSCAQVAG
jgi:dihydrofolate reductase